MSSSLAHNPYVLANILILCSFLNLLVLFLNMVPRTLSALDSSNFQKPNGFLFHHTPCFTAENWERQEARRPGDSGCLPQHPGRQCGGLTVSTTPDGPASLKACFAPFLCWLVGGGCWGMTRLTWFHWLHWVLGCNSRMSKVGMMEEQEMRSSTCGNHG